LNLCLARKSLFGKDGAFAPMLKNLIEKALEGKVNAHLEDREHLKGYKRNGRSKKTIKSGFRTFDIDTPKARQSSFEPELVKKRQTIWQTIYQRKSLVCIVWG